MKIQNVVFIGSKELGYSVLKKMCEIDRNSLKACITINDLQDSRSYFNQIVDFCHKENIDLIVLEKAAKLKDYVQKYSPELCMVVGWYSIIDEHILKSVPYGFIGIHNSLLPAYRGHAPLVWALINGEKEVGFSMFTFEKDMDSGDIWIQRSIKVDEEDSIQDVLAKIEKEVMTTLDIYYVDILKGTLLPQKQKMIDCSYGSKRIPEDGNIVWTKTDNEIYNFVRAQSLPYPGAFTYCNSTKITIWEVEKENITVFGTPGQVIKNKPEGISVICGNNKSIFLKTIQAEEGAIIDKRLFSLNTRLKRMR